MTTGRFLTIALITLGSTLLTVGCGPSSAELQIQKLQEDVDRLSAENGDLQTRLAQAQRESDAARRQALEIQRLLDEARRQTPATDLPEGFVGTKDVAWTEIEESILFDSGKADIKPEGRRKLQDVMRQIDQRLDWADREIIVVGHTDADPIKHSAKLWKDNWDLSANRAMAVVREMVRAGAQPKRLVAAGRGEFAPKATNTTKAGKAQNRRVQIVVAHIPGFAPSSRMTEDAGSGAGS
jgi:chemotaxis protein MotB